MKYNRILLVDDNPTCRLINTKVLQHLNAGTHIDSVDSGLAALTFLEACARDNHWPDLILLDIMMPHMDGFEFLDQCRERALLPSHTTVILLSSSDHVSDRNRAKEHAIEHFIRKPATREKFSVLFY